MKVLFFALGFLICFSDCDSDKLNVVVFEVDCDECDVLFSTEGLDLQRDTAVVGRWRKKFPAAPGEKLYLGVSSTYELIEDVEIVGRVYFNNVLIANKTDVYSFDIFVTAPK